MSRVLTKSIGLAMRCVNISETEGSYMIFLSAPGMQRDDFKIDVEGKLLTISTETANKYEDEGRNRREYDYFSFHRSFILPEEVNREKIEARYEKGVLTVTLPKSEQIKKASFTKKIAVR